MSIRLQVRTPSVTVVLAQENGYVDPATSDRGSRFRISVYADGADLGNAEQRTAVVPWQGSDGDRVEVTGYGNRDQTYKVKVESLTGDDAGLTAGEAYLSQVVGVRSELWWQAPSASEATVYDVETCYLDQEINDALELGVTGDAARPVRVFTLTLTCQPHGRRPVATVVPAMSPGTATSTVTPTVTVVYNGSSITGWVASSAATPGNLGVRAAAGGGVENALVPTVSTFSLLGSPPSLTVPMGGDRFIRVRWATTPARPPVLRMDGANGPGSSLVEVKPVAIIGEYVYYYLNAANRTITRFFWFLEKGQRVTIREIARQNVMPYSTTARQSTATFSVGGAARTALSARIRHTGSLGDLLLYVRCEDGLGNQPPMRVHRSSASTAAIVTDTAAINGSVASLTASTPEIYEPPAAQMPEAPYLVLIRHRPSTSGVGFVYTVSTVLGGQVLGSWSSGLIWRDGFTPGQLTNTELGLVTMPTVRVPPGVLSSAKVRITLSVSQPTGLDEMWAFDTTRGRLIRLAAGTGTPTVGGSASVVMVDAPTMATPKQGIYVGTNPDRTDARHAAATAVGQRQALVAEPGLMTAFVACEREYPALEFEFHERGYHHPGTI